MQFKALTLLALTALATASPELHKRQSASVTENPTELSVLGVLATALPPSLLAIGVTNAAELGSIIASSFSAGETPGWYSALPTDVKSYLTVLYSEVASTTAGASSVLAPLTTPLGNTASLSSIQASISASISSSLNTTTISSVHSASLKASTTAAGSAAGSAAASSALSSSKSTGGAAYPTAVVGAGVAGAIGLLGMLAL